MLAVDLEAYRTPSSTPRVHPAKRARGPRPRAKKPAHYSSITRSRAGAQARQRRWGAAYLDLFAASVERDEVLILEPFRALRGEDGVHLFPITLATARRRARRPASERFDARGGHGCSLVYSCSRLW